MPPELEAEIVKWGGAAASADIAEKNKDTKATDEEIDKMILGMDANTVAAWEKKIAFGNWPEKTAAFQEGEAGMR